MFEAEFGDWIQNHITCVYVVCALGEENISRIGFFNVIRFSRIACDINIFIEMKREL